MQQAHPFPEPGGESLTLTVLSSHYREGDSGAAQELLDRFASYRKRWLRLLTTGQWDRIDPGMRTFLYMLGKVNLDHTAQALSRVLRAYERADLEQELSLAVLIASQRYTTIPAGFPYVLKERIVALIHDPLVANRSWNVEAIEQEPDAHPVEIDEDWVKGLTCGPGFDQLSADERRVLQLHNYHDFTLAQTAQLLDITAGEVDNRLRSARDKLRKAGIG